MSADNFARGVSRVADGRPTSLKIIYIKERVRPLVATLLPMPMRNGEIETSLVSMCQTQGCHCCQSFCTAKTPSIHLRKMAEKLDN